jgi:hypothetical protein
VRASDADRERVALALRDGASHGRLTFGELAERVELAYSATTSTELETLLADLPDAPSAHARATRWMVTVMGRSDRGGRWRPAQRSTAVAVMGGLEADLREAVIDDDEILVRAIAVMGGIELVVPEGVDVQLEGFALIGRNELRLGDVPVRPGTPVVRVRAFSFLGGVEVAVRGSGETRQSRGHLHLGSRRKRRDLPS